MINTFDECIVGEKDLELATPKSDRNVGLGELDQMKAYNKDLPSPFTDESQQNNKHVFTYDLF